METIFKYILSAPWLKAQNTFIWAYGIAIMPTIVFVYLNRLIRSKTSKAQSVRWQWIYLAVMLCLFLLFCPLMILVVTFAFFYLFFTKFFSKKNRLYYRNWKSLKRWAVHYGQRQFNKIIRDHSFDNRRLRNQSIAKAFFTHALFLTVLTFYNYPFYFLKFDFNTCDEIVTNFCTALCIGFCCYFLSHAIIKRKQNMVLIQAHPYEYLCTELQIYAIPFLGLLFLSLIHYPESIKAVMNSGYGITLKVIIFLGSLPIAVPMFFRMQTRLTYKFSTQLTLATQVKINQLADLSCTLCFVCAYLLFFWLLGLNIEILNSKVAIIIAFAGYSYKIFKSS